MLSPPKQIEYVLNRSHYLISKSSARQLSIVVDDLQKKLKRNIFVDDGMLDPYSLTTEQLYHLIYRQYIFENKTAKRMIKFDGEEMLINFDYPKAQIAQLRFKSEQVSTCESTIIIEKINKMFEQRVRQLQSTFQTLKAKVQQQVYQNLLSLLQKIEKKAKEVSLTFDEQVSNKVNQFDKYVYSKEKQYESKFCKFIEDSIAKIISENTKLRKQIEMIPIKIDHKISILDHNIKVQQSRIDDLEKDIDHNQQKNEDEVTNLHAKIQDIAFKINQKIQRIIESFNSSSIKIDKNKQKIDKIQNQSSHKQTPIRLEQNIQELIVKTRKKQEYFQQQYEQTLFKSKENFSQQDSCFIDLFQDHIPIKK